MRTVLRRAAVTAASLATLAGGAVVMAPTASAVGSGACTENVANYNSSPDYTVNYRTGPGTGYTSKGLLFPGNDLRVYCYNGNWAYLKVNSGAHAGTTGWAHVAYISIPMGW